LANRELRELRALFEKDQHNITNKVAAENIKWHFMPAQIPHFGGLWESAVKSLKRLFYNVASEAALTFKEISTLVAQIESILNSRSLTPLLEDPNNLGYLTPGHFLIGEVAQNQASCKKKLINYLNGKCWSV